MVGKAQTMVGRVLVVDDDPSIRALVSEVLEMEGYDVETAANGAEALRAIERERPSTILLDMRMPGVDGWDVARALRDRGLSVPTVVMTAEENAARWAEEIAADAYLAKPFDLDQLLETVERIVPE